MTQEQVNEAANARVNELVDQIQSAIQSRQLKRLQAVVEGLSPVEKTHFERHRTGAPINSHEADPDAANAMVENTVSALAAMLDEMIEHQKAIAEAQYLPKNGGGI